MTEVIIAIAFTTGACAFMFFVLPFMDKNKADESASDSESPNQG